MYNGMSTNYNAANTSYNAQQLGTYGGSSNDSHSQNQHKGKGKQIASSSTQDNRHSSKQSNAPASFANVHSKLKDSQVNPFLSSRAGNASRSSSLVSDSVKVNTDGALTPGQKSRVLDSECKSEPRVTGTPRLRSRRGQSISVATDPAHKQSVTNWLENTPTNNHLTLEEATDTIKRHQSPPKMPSLLAAGTSVTSTLKPINENDPFVSRRPGPFGQSGNISTAIGPYRGTLVGQGGASKQLTLFTQGGATKPSIEAALDPRNLPFIEYCRKTKDESWGVIKIKNVSVRFLSN
jgi:hypothetical protein